MAAADRALGPLDQQIAAGEFQPLLGWLRQRVHAQGRCLTAGDLVEQVSGEPVSERFLVESLHDRYGAVHGLPDRPFRP